ncbi:MAG: DinB family protein [Chitinophagaceae bacterium]|nr:DinB family protein [Chitinophagaceae bacterium]
MDYKVLAPHFIREIKAEVKSTRSCLERIPESLFEYKPHEKSMPFGYLALLVADIPRWISFMIRESVIDFATYPQYKLSTTKALVEFFDDNIKNAISALEEITADQLKEEFSLKNNGQLLYSQAKIPGISEAINHWVHHRGQLTVYMRLNDIPVPSIYGPSADEKTF